MSSSLTWVFFKDRLDIVKHPPSCPTDSFPLPPKAKTASQPVKAYQSRSPALLIPRTDVKLWFDIHLTPNSVRKFSNPNCESSLRQELSLPQLYQPYQPELPCDVSKQVLSREQWFLCSLPRGYKGSIVNVNNLLCLLR